MIREIQGKLSVKHIFTQTNTYIHTCIYVYINTHIYIYIPTHLHIPRAFSCAGPQVGYRGMGENLTVKRFEKYNVDWIITLKINLSPSRYGTYLFELLNLTVFKTLSSMIQHICRGIGICIYIYTYMYIYIYI